MVEETARGLTTTAPIVTISLKFGTARPRSYDGMSAYAAARCLGVRSRARQGNRKIMLEPRKPSAERSKRQVPGSGIDAAAVTVVVSAPVIVAVVVSVTVID